MRRDRHIFVFDIDGVVRWFNPAAVDRPIEQALGLPDGAVMAATLATPEIVEAIEGRMTFEQWAESIQERLRRQTDRPERVAEVFAPWLRYSGEVIPETVALLDILNARTDVAVFAFSNATDHVQAEIEDLGLTDRFRLVLSAAQFGAGKPSPLAFAQAHAAIEGEVGRPVKKRHVHFIDDNRDNVEGALDFGWRAHEFSTAAALREEIGY